MVDLEEMKARHTAAIEKAQEELRVASLAPVAPSHVITGRRPILSYRNVTPAAALALVRAFMVVPGHFWRGSYLGWHYDGETAPRGDAKAQHVAGPFAFKLELRGLAESPGGASLALKFFGRLADGSLCEVWADIEGPGYIGAWPAFHPVADVKRRGAAGRGAVISRRYMAPPALHGLADYTASFSTGAGGPIASGWHFVYAFTADQWEQGPGGDNSHALGQLLTVFQQGGAAVTCDGEA